MASYEHFNAGITMGENMSDEKAAALYRKDADGRLAYAQKLVKLATEQRSYTVAQAQAVVFGLMGELNRRQTGNQYMSNWTEKMREELNGKLAAFGDKAYPLSDRQFESAIRSAW